MIDFPFFMFCKSGAAGLLGLWVYGFTSLRVYEFTGLRALSGEWFFTPADLAESSLR